MDGKFKFPSTKTLVNILVAIKRDGYRGEVLPSLDKVLADIAEVEMDTAYGFRMAVKEKAKHVATYINYWWGNHYLDLQGTIEHALLEVTGNEPDGTTTPQVRTF